MAAAPAMSVGVKLVGTRQLKAKLRRLGSESDELLMVGMVAGGEVIRTAAVANLKNRPLWRSGTLARSIHVEPGGTS